MQVDLFDFELPAGSIAQRPVSPRDASRLLHVQGNALSDAYVADLPGLLKAGDIVVFNDTRVIPARLKGKKGEGAIEVTLHKRAAPDTWHAFARPAKKLKAASHIEFDDGLAADVLEKLDAGEVVLRFNKGGADLMRSLEKVGAMPLPPYIKRENLADAKDDEAYQTMFAQIPGAVAAPTAGLHFTPGLIDALTEKGIAHTTLTLHVGAGTFLPVKVEDTTDHKMHAEWGEIPQGAADAINAARKSGGRVVAVGTTSLRLLESAADDDGTLKAYSGETSIFITPGYRFKITDMLMTNFHLPKSTLFMLVAAFSGLETMKAAYAHAIDGGYRFYSYGDATLLEKSP
ncbi:MAG: tRNA preQ1(34) S-adenosylmethionine ribosyltransferase-isomerase QueA [Rhodospirillaceae bacterium]|nr:tRNA preQ1(34) S-adenosylmethionine ribosyltransferase-isomerase QueA [Rhodospirillaceae bacterium]